MSARKPMGKRQATPPPRVDLDGALCVGKWWLFDSVELADHLEAKALCATCPVRAACTQLRASETAAYPWGGSGPVGTWAGQLLGTNRHRNALRDACGESNYRGVIRGKMEAAQTGECDLTNLGLAPVLSKQNERLTAS